MFPQPTKLPPTTLAQIEWENLTERIRNRHRSYVLLREDLMERLEFLAEIVDESHQHHIGQFNDILKSNRPGHDINST